MVRVSAGVKSNDEGVGADLAIQQPNIFDSLWSLGATLKYYVTNGVTGALTLTHSDSSYLETGLKDDSPFVHYKNPFNSLFQVTPNCLGYKFKNKLFSSRLDLIKDTSCVDVSFKQNPYLLIGHPTGWLTYFVKLKTEHCVLAAPKLSCRGEAHLGPENIKFIGGVEKNLESTELFGGIGAYVGNFCIGGITSYSQSSLETKIYLEDIDDLVRKQH